MSHSKKMTSIRMEPRILKELKFLGVEHDKPLGEVIEALLEFSKADQHVFDDDWNKRFRDLREDAFVNTGTIGGYAGEPKPEPDHFDPTEGND